MLKLAVSVCLLVAGASLVTADCGSLTQSLLGSCYQSFVGYYGFSFNGQLPAYWDMHEARGAILKKGGVGAQPAVCQTANNLVQCTSRIQNWGPACLMSFGLNSTDAQDYYTDLAVGGYQCSDGYTTLIKDFTCIGTVRAAQGAPLAQCDATMKQQIMSGMDICQAENNWLMCQSSVYTQACNFNVGVFMCGANRAGVNANSDLCDKAGKLIQCPPYQ